MPGYDDTLASPQLKKLLTSPPKPPARVKGKKSDRKLYRAFVDTRTNWVDQVQTAGGTLEDAVKALKTVGHIITEDGLKNRKYAKFGLAAPKTRRFEKKDLEALQTLLNDLVERAVRPVLQENARLRLIEKEYNAMKALLAKVSLVAGEDSH